MAYGLNDPPDELPEELDDCCNVEVLIKGGFAVLGGEDMDDIRDAEVAASPGILPAGPYG